MEQDSQHSLAQTREQVRAAQAGSRSALDDLFTRYLPQVRAIAVARLGPELARFTDIDDVVQDAVRAAIVGLERFEHRSEGSFKNWLAVCVENTIRKEARRQQAEKRGAGRVQRMADLEQSRLRDSLFPDPGHSASAGARGHETEERIERAMLELTPRYREVIALRVHAEMSFHEIAETMGLPSENTANALFIRARMKLAKLL